MTDEQRQRVHAITYSCDDRAELAERIVTLEDENAKLREYVQMLAKATVYDPCEWCQYEDEDCPTETEPMREGCRLRSELRGLGVEVDA